MAIRKLLFSGTGSFEIFQRNQLKAYIDNFNISKDYKLSEVFPKDIVSTKSAHLYMINLQRNFSREPGPFFYGLCRNNLNRDLLYYQQKFVQNFNLFDQINVFLPQRWLEPIKSDLNTELKEQINSVSSNSVSSNDNNNVQGSENLLSKDEIFTLYKSSDNDILSRTVKIKDFPDLHQHDFSENLESTLKKLVIISKQSSDAVRNN